MTLLLDHDDGVPNFTQNTNLNLKQIEIKKLANLRIAGLAQ